MDLSRSEKLLGLEALAKLAEARVIIFGVGGVGSWCAESLVRTGLVHLTIVDSDAVEESNVNRQLMATSSTVGIPKVAALKARLLDINPVADIVAIEKRYTDETAAEFDLSKYDFVVDAIDSVDSKARLITEALKVPSLTLFSSMGAALKLDSLRVKVAEFKRIEGDGLARALRGKFKKAGGLPTRKFLCVYSDEPPVGDKSGVKGSLAHVTGAFGFALTGLILRSISDIAKG